MKARGYVIENIELRRAIENGDECAARVAVRAIAAADLYRDQPIALSCADEADAALMKKGKSLFEAYNGDLSLPPQDEWTKDLLSEISGSLDWNFSRERLVRLQEVTVWLHNKERKSSHSFQNSRMEQAQSSDRNALKLNKCMIYALVGAAAALAFGVVAFRLLARNH